MIPMQLSKSRRFLGARFTEPSGRRTQVCRGALRSIEPTGGHIPKVP